MTSRVSSPICPENRGTHDQPASVAIARVETPLIELAHIRRRYRLGDANVDALAEMAAAVPIPVPTAYPRC